MPEPDVDEISVTETPSEPPERPEPAKRAPHKRVTDTLTDENPLICRGLD